MARRSASTMVRTARPTSRPAASQRQRAGDGADGPLDPADPQPGDERVQPVGRRHAERRGGGDREPLPGGQPDQIAPDRPDR